MNKGFRIKIERGLSAEDKKKAQDFATKWALEVIENDCSWVERWSRGGWSSYLQRGTFGYSLNGRGAKNEDDLVFRRISKRRRIFAVMRAKHLRNLDGSEIDFKGCMCPDHLGGTRVIMPQRPALKTFMEYGEIKG